MFALWSGSHQCTQLDQQVSALKANADMPPSVSGFGVSFCLLLGCAGQVNLLFSSSRCCLSASWNPCSESWTQGCLCWGRPHPIYDFWHRVCVFFFCVCVCVCLCVCVCVTCTRCSINKHGCVADCCPPLLCFAFSWCDTATLTWLVTTLPAKPSSLSLGPFTPFLPPPFCPPQHSLDSLTHLTNSLYVSYVSSV